MARSFAIHAAVAAVAALCLSGAAATVLSQSTTLTHDVPQTHRATTSTQPQWGATAHDAANTNHVVAPGITVGNWTRSFPVAPPAPRTDATGAMDPSDGWTPYTSSLMAASATGCVLVVMQSSTGMGVACLSAGDGSTQWLTPLPKISDNLSSAPVVLVNGGGNVIVVGIASGNQLPTVVYTLDGTTGDVMSAPVFDTLAEEDLGRLAATFGDDGRLYVAASLTIGVVQDAKLVGSFTVHADSDVWYNDASVSGDVLLLGGSDGQSFNFLFASLASDELVYAAPEFYVPTFAAGDDNTLFYGFMSETGGLTSVDGASGKVTASVNFTGGQVGPSGMVYISPPSSSGSQGSLVMSSRTQNGATVDHALMSYDTDLRQLWSQAMGSRAVHPVGVIRGTTNVVVAYSLVASSLTDPKLHFVDARTGRIIATAAMETSSASFVEVNGAVLINTGAVYSISPGDDQTIIACVAPSL